MPRANFGEKINPEKTSARYFQLKQKGEKVTLRFLANGAYDARHFIKTGEHTNVSLCDRLMSEDGNMPCDACQTYFDLAKSLKAEKELLTASELKSKEKERDEWKPKMTFYYPAVNRATGEAVIFKTTFMIRKALETEVANGINVLEYDYTITRTEEGGNYYTLSRLPEKDCKPLSVDEKEAADELLSVDILERIKVRQSSMDMGESHQETEVNDDAQAEPTKAEQQKMDEDINPDDIPF